jgi:hypothetical protein
MHAAHAAAPRQGRYKDRSVRAGIWSQAGPCQRCSFSHKEANGPALGKGGASLTLASGPALFLSRPRRDGWGRQFCDASPADRSKAPNLGISKPQLRTQPTQPLQVRILDFQTEQEERVGVAAPSKHSRVSDAHRQKGGPLRLSREKESA